MPSEVQFYRNVAANSPYADVQSAPPVGDPPDACGGYVMANLPNDVVSLVHVPQVPTFPDYQGATDTTLNDNDQYDLAFYSVVIYGAKKQLDALGTVKNSQIGNRQIKVNERRQRDHRPVPAIRDEAAGRRDQGGRGRERMEPPAQRASRRSSRRT